MSSKRELKLDTTKDWDAWLAVIKRKAVGYRIWIFVDPSNQAKPEQLEEPEEPDIEVILKAVSTAQDIASLGKVQFSQYKAKKAKWDEQQESIIKLMDFIYESITVPNLISIQKTEVHPYNMLRALKQRLAPSDSARLLEIEQDYARLKSGPSPHQNSEVWLDEWTRMYELAKELKLAEVVDSSRTYRDFLLAIWKHAPVLA